MGYHIDTIEIKLDASIGITNQTTVPKGKESPGFTQAIQESSEPKLPEYKWGHKPAECFDLSVKKGVKNICTLNICDSFLFAFTIKED